MAYILARRSPEGFSRSLRAASAMDAIHLSNAQAALSTGPKKGSGDADLDAFAAWAGRD